MIAALLLLAAADPGIRSSPELGVAAARCRAEESGPAVIVNVTGLKVRKGRVRAELYPARDGDFLGDDNVLVAAGKTFRRASVEVPASGPVRLCLRVPGPGTYSLAVIHNVDGGHKFSLSRDGAGFGGNPKIGLSKPSAQAASVSVGNGPTETNVVMNYRRGLFSFGPVAAN